MKRVLLIAVGCVLLAFCVVWASAGPDPKVKTGDTVEPMTLANVVGGEVKIPSPTARLVHLQFRRFAGCPICNLHMHEMIDRYGEITERSIKEVVVFHSPKEALAPYQGKFPFDVIADPDKKLYERFGVDESVFALLDPRVWPTMFRAVAREDKPTGEADGGPWTRPAEFLIDPFGRIVASHYGRHAYDQWTVDEILENARR